MFKAKTVDSVLKVFTAAIEDLEKVEREQANLATSKTAEARFAEAEAAVANAEADRASNIAKNLRAILS